MDNKKSVIAHLSMFMACAFWGLMAPVGKDAMTHGVTGIDMVTFRVIGGATLFWITSLFVKREKVSSHDLFLFFFAGLFGLVMNQCCYTIGLSITSPVNASIVVTSMPIFAMILSAIILHEPITSKKVMGIFLGCIGALMIIITSASAVNAKVGDIRGDLLCMFAQLSFALYLTLFNHLIKKYSVITVNKWMFTYAVIMIVPFSFRHIAAIEWMNVPDKTWWEVGYVVFFGTYICYILTMVGQKTLRPTVVSIYNYVQPLVSVSVSVIAGIATFKWGQAIAVILVFLGVWLVTISKSRADILKEKNQIP